MPSLARRTIARRARRVALGHQPLNLVPLVDILTSIVFFSLLTYGGARALAALTRFDLQSMSAAAGARGGGSPVTLGLTLSVDRTGVRVARARDAAERRFEGLGDASLRGIRGAVAELGRGVPADAAIGVVPADDVSYEDLIRVLDQVRAAGRDRIALGLRKRT